MRRKGRERKEEREKERERKRERGGERTITRDIIFTKKGKRLLISHLHHATRDEGN